MLLLVVVVLLLVVVVVVLLVVVVVVVLLLLLLFYTPSPPHPSLFLCLFTTEGRPWMFNALLPLSGISGLSILFYILL